MLARKYLTDHEILSEIEIVREDLHALILRYGIDSEKVLKCSEVLDELISRLKDKSTFIKKTSTGDL